MLQNPRSYRKYLLYADSQSGVRRDYIENAILRDIVGDPSETQSTLIYTTRHDMVSNIKNHEPTAIFIPENQGPVSQIREHLLPHIKLLRQYAFNGGKIIFFGACAHYAMDEVIWAWNEDHIVHRKPNETFCLVSGRTEGPIYRTPYPGQEIKFNGCFEVPIVVNPHNKRPVRETFWQGNCGAFILDDERDRPNIKILAHYDEIDSSPIAAFEISVGIKGGSYILCSGMPFYTPKNVLWSTIVKSVTQEKTRIKLLISELRHLARHKG